LEVQRNAIAVFDPKLSQTHREPIAELVDFGTRNRTIKVVQKRAIGRALTGIREHRKRVVEFELDIARKPVVVAG
jgi:hypothetical protein